MTTLRRSSALVLVLAITALAPAAASAHDPVLFVHGWNSNSSTWNTMISRFTADGWTTAELNNWSYNYSQSNATTASQISTKVNQILAPTGAGQGYLIRRSMAGLSTRYYG